MNTRIPPGRGNPPTKEPPTDKKRRRWRKGKPHEVNPGPLWKYKKIVKKLLRTNNWTSAREKPQNLLQTEEPAPTQPAHTCTTENKRWGTDWPSDNQLVGRTHQRKTQQQPKTKDIHRANINHSLRSVRSGHQGDCTTESHRYSTTEVYTINPGGQNRST